MTSPTRVRYQVLVLACLLAALTYLDRICFGAAAPLIIKELGLTSVADLKWAFAAFAIAYGLFEVPTGWWGDRFGPRRVLIRVVLWWSFFTTLTGLVGWQAAGLTFGGLAFLIVVRFLFGAGEAGAFPNIARALQNWFPPQARARAQGCVWMTARLAGGLTPLLWTYLVAGTEDTSPLVSWREAFLLFGLLGVLWCLLFAWRFRNRPEEHVDVNPAERDVIAAGRAEQPTAPDRVPWIAILFSRNLLCMYVMYFSITYGWFFNVNYLPDCLETRYGVERTSPVGSLFKGGPFILGAIGCLLGGYCADALLRRGTSLRWSRRLPGLIGLVLCAGCYLTAARMPSAWSFALAIALAGFCNDLVMGGAWSTCQDVGGRHTAVVAGCLNTAASIGAALASWASGEVLQWYLDARASELGIAVERLRDREWASERTAALAAGYEANLLIYAAVTLVAAIAWLGANAERPLCITTDTRPG
jgi:ACS family glucarate transporter-like MFS transporter